ncbi:hypothetical protein PoB_007049600 [Plakobranchus ocellatus]|uniref:SEFIR domain-containing protein n=1 Tax=Plakobranchus ocellatus TaxID=259542 RepID=A0AAV4DIL6_9GAST|nr:hypothetical protein PoB_007049600 [Plakobranchus ocellatus]
MKRLTVLQRFFLVMIVTSLFMPKMCQDINYNRTGCYASCSNQVNCTVRSVLCTLEPQKEVKADKRIPNAVSDLQVYIDDQLHRPVLRISWKLPSDGSYSLLDKFEIKATEKTRNDQARCYHATPSHQWRNEHEKSNSNVSFFMDCIDIKKDEKVEFHVSVTSLPMDPFNIKKLSRTVKYGNSVKWRPEFLVYSGNSSDLHLFVSSSYPGGKAHGYVINVKLAKEGTSVFYKGYSQEPKDHQLPFNILNNGSLHFHIPEQFQEDKEYYIEIEPTDSNQGSLNFYYYSTPGFLYHDLVPWGPIWSPRLEGLQPVKGSRSVETDNQGRPLTYLVLHRPMPNAAFYRLMIYGQYAGTRKGRKLILNEAFIADPNHKTNGARALRDRNGYLEFVVEGLDLESNYTFSMDALDAYENFLPGVRRVTDLPLHVVGFNQSHEPVLAPATDNRMKIIIGLVITAGFLLVVTAVWFCLSKRSGIRSRGAALPFVRSSVAMGRPSNNKSLKIIPIYCWENEHYQNVVRRHVNLIRQYACISSTSSDRIKREKSRWRCWVSAMTWCWRRGQKTVGRDLEAEMKGSEVIIYLSPRLAYLMSAEPGLSQPVNSYDTECEQLLSTFTKLHCRGMGRKPHFVTFDCFNKDELICLDAFQWMMAPTSTLHHGQRASPARMAFTSAASTVSPSDFRGDREQIEMVVHHAAPNEISNEETVGLILPLALAVQVSGVWRLQNIRELVTRLHEMVDYPNRRRLPSAFSAAGEDWRALQEVQVIEQELELAANCYLQSHHCTQAIHPISHDTSVDGDTELIESDDSIHNEAVGDDANIAYLCQASTPEKHLLHHESFLQSSTESEEARYNTSNDQNAWRVKGNLGDEVNLDFPQCRCSGKRDSDKTGFAGNALITCSSSIHQNKLSPSDNPISRSRAAHKPALPTAQSAPQGQGCSRDTGSTDCSDVDFNVDHPGSKQHKPSNHGSKKKLKAASWRILHPLKNSSSHELTTRISNDGLSSPRAAFLPLATKGVSELNTHPLGFSQDIIPPNQCCGSSSGGFTAEQIARLNADGGWSEEDLVDTCGL